MGPGYHGHSECKFSKLKMCSNVSMYAKFVQCFCAELQGVQRFIFELCLHVKVRQHVYASLCAHRILFSLSLFIDPHQHFVISMSLRIAVILCTASVALTHLLHREKLERCRYHFIWNTLFSASLLEREEGNSSAKIFMCGSPIVYIMDHYHYELLAVMNVLKDSCTD